MNETIRRLPLLPSSDLLTWLGIDKEAFVSGLQQRIPDESRLSCESLADDLLRIHPLLRHAFKVWWDTAEISDLGEFSGYTVSDLLTGAKGTIKFEPTGAFLMLNTLITEPQKAREHLATPVYGFTPVCESQMEMPPMTRDLPPKKTIQ